MSDFTIKQMKCVPLPPKGCSLFAVNCKTGAWHYVNHAEEWHGMPNPLEDPVLGVMRGPENGVNCPACGIRLPAAYSGACPDCGSEPLTDAELADMRELERIGLQEALGLITYDPSSWTGRPNTAMSPLEQLKLWLIFTARPGFDCECCVGQEPWRGCYCAWHGCIAPCEPPERWRDLLQKFVDRFIVKRLK